MAYTTDVNTLIINHLSTTQSRIAAIAASVAEKVMRGKKVSSYQHLLDEADDLIAFNDALDNNYNDWTEAEIEQLINSIASCYNTQDYPYVNRGRVNLNITFS